MKHWKITLQTPERTTRQWSLWADTLTVGSSAECSLVLPPPVAALVGSFTHSARLKLPFGELDIWEDTPERIALWAKARERILQARRMDWQIPGSRQAKRRRLVFLGLGCFALLTITGTFLLAPRTARLPQIADVEGPIIDLLPPAPVEPPPPPTPAQTTETPANTAPTPTPTDASAGPIESSTQPVVNPTSAQKVMDNSVMAQLQSQEENTLGIDLDPNQANAVDVVIAGKMGSMRKATNGMGGNLASGNNDRMGMNSGWGFSGGGTNGRQKAIGNRNGKLTKGDPSRTSGIKMTTAVISSPRPEDVELGGESGSRSAESILSVIRKHISGFRYTYEKFLRETPDLGGKISLKFTIAPSGDIVAISVVSSNTGNAELDESLKEKARRMKFDTIEKGNVTVTYAFVLDKQ